jgi:outer membrane protein OmpA-like peptidoglycan-associated protein
MKGRYLLGAGAMLALAFGGAEANAQSTYTMWGWSYPYAFYIGPEGGWTSLQNQNNNVTNVPNNLGIPGRNNVQFDSGFNAGVRAGVQWGPIRVEEEYSYKHNGLSNLGPFANNSANGSVSGNRNTNGIMTNFIYDFTTLFGWPITPHLGFGIGAVDIVDSASLTSGTIPGPISFTLPTGPVFIPGLQTFGGTLFKNNSGWQFGYQGIAGIRYDINPLLAFDLDYRYLATTQGTFNNKGVFPFPSGNKGTNVIQGLRYRTGYSTNNLVASLTMKFGAPPAPPPPAPPAPPPPPVHQVYLVFFDWDKYNITAEGQQILVLAANQYKSGGRVQLQVTGYTDLSGSAGYNQRLSERRANAVAAALEKLGVPRSDMVVTGRGMNDPRVPTAPGVREPQNRRVEIVLP